MRENGPATSTQPRGIGSLIPARTQATPDGKAAAQLLHLREANAPVPFLAAAAAPGR
ncbi:hypothetical protein [Kitasatospora sp. NPDC004272]